MTDQERQAKIEDRKATRSVINHVRTLRRRLQKERESMTPEEWRVFSDNRIANLEKEFGYTRHYIEGREGCYTISRRESAN
jgi:hypothetical protein